MHAEQERRLPPHVGVTAMVCMGNGPRFLCGMEDGRITVYNTKDKVFTAFQKGSPILSASVAWSPVGGLLAEAGLDGHCRAWNLETGQQVFSKQVSGISLTTVAWSPDGELIVVGSRKGEVKVLQAATATVKQSLTCEQWVLDAVFCPDGKQVAAALNNDFVRVWEVASGNEVDPVERPDRPSVRASAWSPDGRWLALGGADSRIHLLNGKSLELVRSWPTGHGHVGALLWASSDVLITTNFPNGFPGTYRWRVPEGRLLKRTEESLWHSHVTMTDLGPARAISASNGLRGVSPDGTRLATRLGSARAIQNVETGETELILCALHGGSWLAVNPRAGHFTGDLAADETPVFVVQRDARQENLTPAAFAARFGWENRP